MGLNFRKTRLRFDKETHITVNFVRLTLILRYGSSVHVGTTVLNIGRFRDADGAIGKAVSKKH